MTQQLNIISGDFSREKLEKISSGDSITIYHNNKIIWHGVLKEDNLEKYANEKEYKVIIIKDKK